MLELFKTRNEVVKDGKTLRFTNFKLAIKINGQKVFIPIQPVNFGEKSNRTNYSILNMAATEYQKEKDKTPF